MISYSKMRFIVNKVHISTYVVARALWTGFLKDENVLILSIEGISRQKDQSELPVINYTQRAKNIEIISFRIKFLEPRVTCSYRQTPLPHK